MNRFISISVRMSLIAFGMIAFLMAKANSSSLDERFKVSLNTVIQNVRETEDPVAKRGNAR